MSHRVLEVDAVHHDQINVSPRVGGQSQILERVDDNHDQVSVGDETGDVDHLRGQPVKDICVYYDDWTGGRPAPPRPKPRGRKER